MYYVYKKTKNYFPIKLCAINEVTGEIEGVLNGVTVREMTGLLGKTLLGEFSTRSIIEGGPLVSNSSIDCISKMIIEYDKKVQRKSVYTETWNFNEMKDLLDKVENYEYEDHLNFIINLEVLEEDLWKQIHRSRRRNIKKAISEGIIVEEINNRKMIPIFYDLIKETYTRASVPFPDISLFESAFDQLVPENMAKFFLAKHNDIYLSSLAVLTYNHTIFAWYFGTSSDGFALFPNDYLVWHVLKWGIENNYKLFDFGGAGKPDVEYGPREFKRRFGGTMVNYGRHVHIHSPIKKKITDYGLKMYQESSFMKKVIT